jgi:hypothetical protein
MYDGTKRVMVMAWNGMRMMNGFGGHAVVFKAFLMAASLAVLFSSGSVIAQETGNSTPGPNDVPYGCIDGQLRVGDLQHLDAEWAEMRTVLDTEAIAWESDAFLTGLQVNCGILEPGFRWRGTYYSPSAQAFYATDTGQTIGAEFDPDEATELPENLKFGAVWRALAKAGYADNTTLSPATGITVQMNSSATPLGPAEIPLDMVVCHVGLEYLGEIRDLFISIEDGAVYRHTFP